MGCLSKVLDVALPVAGAIVAPEIGIPAALGGAAGGALAGGAVSGGGIKGALEGGLGGFVGGAGIGAGASALKAGGGFGDVLSAAGRGAESALFHPIDTALGTAAAPAAASAPLLNFNALGAPLGGASAAAPAAASAPLDFNAITAPLATTLSDYATATSPSFASLSLGLGAQQALPTAEALLSGAPQSAPQPAPGGVMSDIGSFVKEAAPYVPAALVGVNALSGGSVAHSLGAQQPMPGQSTFQALGTGAANAAEKNLATYNAGNVTPTEAAAVDQFKKSAKARVDNYYASIGMSDSSAHAQALASIDEQAMAYEQQLLQQNFTNAMHAAGVAQGPLTTIAGYQLQQDKALQGALANASSAASYLAGQHAAAATPAS